MDIEINVTPRKMERIIFLLIIAALIVVIIILYAENSKKCELGNTTIPQVIDKNIAPENKQDTANPATSSSSGESQAQTCTPEYRCTDDYHYAQFSWNGTACSYTKATSCIDGCKDGICINSSTTSAGSQETPPPAAQPPQVCNAEYHCVGEFYRAYFSTNCTEVKGTKMACLDGCKDGTCI